MQSEKSQPKKPKKKWAPANLEPKSVKRTKKLTTKKQFLIQGIWKKSKLISFEVELEQTKSMLYPADKQH